MVSIGKEIPEVSEGLKMVDTLASLKQELKALGSVDYSTNTRNQREMILSEIAAIENVDQVIIFDQDAADAKRLTEGRTHAINFAKINKSCYCSHCHALADETN